MADSVVPASVESASVVAPVSDVSASDKLISVEPADSSTADSVSPSSVPQGTSPSHESSEPDDGVEAHQPPLAAGDAAGLSQPIKPTETVSARIVKKILSFDIMPSKFS